MNVVILLTTVEQTLSVRTLRAHGLAHVQLATKETDFSAFRRKKSSDAPRTVSTLNNASTILTATSTAANAPPGMEPMLMAFARISMSARLWFAMLGILVPIIPADTIASARLDSSTILFRQHASILMNV